MRDRMREVLETPRIGRVDMRVAPTADEIAVATSVLQLSLIHI